MSPLSLSITSAVCLAAFALAAPVTQNLPSSSLVQPRWAECASGTWYYKCGAIDGCFDHDPCETTTEQPTTSPGPACPTDQSQSGLRVMPSTYWAINANSPDQQYDEPSSRFYLLNDTSRPEDPVLEQVLIFEGVDVARAKTCKLTWYLDLQEDTQFEVEGDGYVRFTQLPGFPAGQVPTYSLAQQLETAGAASMLPAMGGWDDKSVYLGQKKTSSQEVPCSEVLAFRAKMDSINNEGRNEVDMVPSETVGVSVDYWC
ncbi:hypothetical protein SLS62_008861 [Diatrype stigma]|uniref:Uncharacterized protein n=1 Tax=Diatrype stigma TaxID=117547 RepID=A0AAN9UGX9_9PEZI